jgi:retron-type reverse transcriptase
MDVLTEAWKRVGRNKGSAGVDGTSIREIENETGVEVFLSELQEELRSGSYTASEIKRVYIPKGSDGKRPLGIPTVKDRVVQMAVKLIIEPLFEADFQDCSYGFRPKRSNTQAVKLAHGYSNTSKSRLSHHFSYNEAKISLFLIFHSLNRHFQRCFL